MATALAAHIIPTLFAGSLLLWTPVSAVEVRFFYSPLKDSCEWGGNNAFPATNNTANGGLCAYVPSRNRLFACPAQDDKCWGFNVNCGGGSSATPGDNQILCGRSNGQQWCCGQNEDCTTAPGQINVCIPNDFPNPNADVSPAEARAAEFSALPSASIVTNLPTNTPSVFSTLSPSTSSASKTSSKSSSSSNGDKTPGATAGAANNNGNRTNKKSGSGGGISGGAIAGIVIGAIAGTLIVVGLILWLLKRRRNSRAVGPDGGYYEKPQEDRNTQYAPSTAGGSHTPASQYPHSGYYGGEVYAKVAPEEEMPGHMPPEQAPVEMPAHSKPQELP